MAHESFEDEAAAKIQNEHFVNIKVDMEERPDVDQIYMNFVQLTTGRGGWPMNVFLTPDKLPFFGGTYFPPSPRFNMPAWSQILLSIAEAWRERRNELLHSAAEILGELRRVGIAEFGGAGPSHELLDAAFHAFDRSFDAANGGWGGAPKFPQAMSIEFLLRHWKRTGSERALAMAEFTARKMANGGIYDHLGGGFHRYATDAVWLVPHFEKMLYDNAQLVPVYLHLYQITNDEFFRRVAVETLEYIRREMLDDAGGFYSSQDADSDGEEGKFFVWDVKEIERVLGAEGARRFGTYYGVTVGGNFEGHNILNVRAHSDEIWAELGEARAKLFDEREKRNKPFRDEKILTAWNGLMLAAFAEAAAVLGDDIYLQTAQTNADFLLSSLQGENGLLRTWKAGRAKLNGYIEDYANLADGLIALYRASGEVKYLLDAKRLADEMITGFWDEEVGGFFFTSNNHEELIVRNKDFYDNATPSGNSAAADVLLRLARYFGDERYERFGTTVLRLVASQIPRYPQGFGRALSAAEFQLAPAREIVVVGEAGNDLERKVLSNYEPLLVFASSRDPEGDGRHLPLVAERTLVDGRPAAYVCEDFVCRRPVTEIADLQEVINESPV
jgi:uncharacterized protein YyaL (SSP411 family)